MFFIIVFTGTLLYALDDISGEHRVTPSITLTNDTITIESFSYFDTFLVEDIIDIELLRRYPKGIRSSGSSTRKFVRGDFNLSKHGEARMYIMKDTKLSILIKLEDYTIIYNESTLEDTLHTYYLLLSLKEND